jgi:hypothetical protein
MAARSRNRFVRASVRFVENEKTRCPAQSAAHHLLFTNTSVYITVADDAADESKATLLSLSLSLIQSDFH